MPEIYPEYTLDMPQIFFVIYPKLRYTLNLQEVYQIFFSEWIDMYLKNVSDCFKLAFDLPDNYFRHAWDVLWIIRAVRAKKSLSAILSECVKKWLLERGIVKLKVQGPNLELTLLSHSNKNKNPHLNFLREWYLVSRIKLQGQWPN